MIKIVSFQVVRLINDDRPVILIYALGENGMLYEMSGGRWVALPIGDDAPTLAEVQAEQKARQTHGRIIKPKKRNDDEDD
jgi:hypothetical protein